MSSGDLAYFVMSLSYKKYMIEQGFTLKCLVVHLPAVF